jgi:hypothetical protein
MRVEGQFLNLHNCCTFLMVLVKQAPLAFPDLLEAKLLLDQDHRDPTRLVLGIDGQQFIDGAGLAVGLLDTFAF